MALATAKIKIEGDAKDAVGAFKDAEKAGGSLREELNDLGSGFGDMAKGMITAEAIMATVRAGMEFVREASAAYAEENRLVADGMATVADRGHALKAAFGGLILGGDGTTQSMAALSQVMEYFTGVLEDNEGALAGNGEVMIVLIRTMQHAARFGNALIDVFGLLKLAGEALGQGMVITFEAVQGLGLALYDVTSFISGTAIEAFAGLAEGAINLADTIGIGGLLPEGARESMESLRELGESMQEVPPFAERMADTMDAVAYSQGEMTNALDEFAADAERRQQILEGFDAVMDEIVDGLKNGTLETDNFVSSQEAMGAAVAATTERLKEQMEQLRLKAEAEAMDAKRKESEAAAMERAAFARDEADMSARAAFGRQQEKDAIQETIDAQRALEEQRKESARNTATIVANEAAAVLKGQKSMKEAVFGTIAGALEAKAMANFIEGTAMMFIPGAQAQAAGHLAAAAAYAAGAASVRALGGIGGGKGGGSTAASAGAAPAERPAAQMGSTTTINVSPNFGVVGDPRMAAGMIADQVRYAAREGML